MLKTSQDPMDRIKALIETWRTTAPTRSLYGMTLDQYIAKVKPAFDVDDEIAGLDKMQRAARAKRKDLRLAAADLTQNVVHAVKADPALGENSTMYAALGYVRKSDRYPRRRRVQVSSASVPTEGDTKVQDPSVQKLEEEVKP